MTHWTDRDGHKITLGSGIACSRGRGGEGCRNMFMLFCEDIPGPGFSILEEPSLKDCRRRTDAEKTVNDYAREHGWEIHSDELFDLEEVT